MKTLTKEEIHAWTEKLQSDCQFVCDLALLFNSIKTLGAADELAILLKNTRPDVNKCAKTLAKIPIFKKRAAQIGIQVSDILEEAQKMEYISNPVFIGKLQEHCCKEKKFKEFYRLVGRMDTNYVKSFGAKDYVNRKFHTVVYDEIAEDFKKYRKNAEEFARGTA